MCTNIFFYILNMGPSFNECMRTIYIKLQMYKYNVCRFFFPNFFNNHCNYVYHYYIIDKDVLYKHVCIVYVLGIQTFTSKQIFFNKKGFRNNECIHCTFVQPFLCSFAFKFLHNLFKITFNKINI